MFSGLGSRTDFSRIFVLVRSWRSGLTGAWVAEEPYCFVVVPRIIGGNLGEGGKFFLAVAVEKRNK
jgi:hypothetical protein